MSTTSPFAKPTTAVIDRASRWTNGCARLTAAAWTGFGWRAAQARGRLMWRWAETRHTVRARAQLGSERARRLASEVRAELAASAGWAIVLTSATVMAFAYAFTTSWASTLHAGALGLIAALLLSIHAVQRHQAAVLQGQLDELRRLLHVTEAVLDVDEDVDAVEGAEELDEVTVARAPEPGRARPKSLAARIRRLGQRLRR